MVVRAAFFAALLSGCQLLPSSMPQPASTQPARPRVAVFTFSGGFKHDVLALAEQTIGELAAESGAFDVTLLGLHQQAADKIDLGVLTPEFLQQHAAIVFYTTSGERDLELLTAGQREALLAAIRGGTAFIGIHSATDTFYRWPEYGEMIGAYFDGHPWVFDGPPVTIRVEDAAHPACLGLGESWFLQDEIYQFREPYSRDRLHVLLSLDTRATDMSVPGIRRTDGDFALAWTKFHGRGRVFYTALGHRDDVWRNPQFRGHLLGGIRWALGQMGGKPLAPEKEQNAPIHTASGLQYQDLVVGEGPEIRRGDTVKIDYTGWLADGTKFDSSLDRGQPLVVLIGYRHVIAGWDEGIPGMRIGGVRRLVIPPRLAYGKTGSPPTIPAEATLTFEVRAVGFAQ